MWPTRPKSKFFNWPMPEPMKPARWLADYGMILVLVPVSYTHLTLPTTERV